MPWDGRSWPWATFAANVGGVVLLAYLVTRLHLRAPDSRVRRPFFATGLCGALTTFSTLQIELIRLARAGEPLLAGAYLGASVLLGLVGATAAVRLARRPERR